MLHALVLPPLLLAMFLLARGARARWARHRAALLVSVTIAAATLALGVLGEVVLLDLAPVYRGDLLLYTIGVSLMGSTPCRQLCIAATYTLVIALAAWAVSLLVALTPRPKRQ